MTTTSMKKHQLEAYDLVLQRCLLYVEKITTISGMRVSIYKFKRSP